MAVKMCDIKPSKEEKKYLKRIDAPTHYCSSCGRVANDEKYLCAAKKISPPKK